MIAEEILTTLVAEHPRGSATRHQPVRRQFDPPSVAPPGPAHGIDSLVDRLEAAAEELAASPPELDISSWAQFDAALRSLHGALEAIRGLEGDGALPSSFSSPKAGSSTGPRATHTADSTRMLADHRG